MAVDGHGCGATAVGRLGCGKLQPCRPLLVGVLCTRLQFKFVFSLFSVFPTIRLASTHRPPLGAHAYETAPLAVFCRVIIFRPFDSAVLRSCGGVFLETRNVSPSPHRCPTLCHRNCACGDLYRRMRANLCRDRARYGVGSFLALSYNSAFVSFPLACRW